MNVNIPPHPTTPHDQHKIISVTWTLTLTSHPSPPQSNKNWKTHKKHKTNFVEPAAPAQVFLRFETPLIPRFVHNGRDRSGSCHVVCGRHRADAGGGRSVAASVVGPQAPPPAQPELGGQRISGTSLNLTRRLQQCTPELFWAEDPISLCCCRKKHQKDNKTARRPAAPMATTVYQ